MVCLASKQQRIESLQARLLAQAGELKAKTTECERLRDELDAFQRWRGATQGELDEVRLLRCCAVAVRLWALWLRWWFHAVRHGMHGGIQPRSSGCQCAGHTRRPFPPLHDWR